MATATCNLAAPLEEREDYLSVCPPPSPAVDFSTGSNESEKNHCCNGDDGRRQRDEARVTQTNIVNSMLTQG